MSKFIFKINPEHCPADTFDNRCPELWEAGQFDVPWPRTLDGRRLKPHEVKAGDECWIWLHVKHRKERDRLSPGLVGRAIISSAAENSNVTSDDKRLSVHFSDVIFFTRPILRKGFEEHKERSEAAMNLLRHTTRRVAALTDDQATEFENFVNWIYEAKIRQIEQYTGSASASSGSESSADSGSPREREKTASTSQGYESDPAVRRAIELRAMEAATRAYERNGYQVEDVSENCPYDLLCSKPGAKQRRVEVKGTRGSASVVTLTAGEVNAAREPSAITDLFIVSEIQVSVLHGNPVASRGKTHVIQGWVPKDLDLEPTQYRYNVPTSQPE